MQDRVGNKLALVPSCFRKRCSVEREADTFSNLLLYRCPYGKLIALPLAFALMGLLAAPVLATELKPGTASAFDRYVQVTEERMAKDLHQGIFLRIDALPEVQQQDAYERLLRGEVIVEHISTTENGRAIDAPHGLIHDWAGIVFIPGATLAQTVAFLQDYDNHASVYGSTIRRSKVLERDGDHFKVYVRSYSKQITTVVMDAILDDVYTDAGSSEVMSKSYSTRITEVADAGEPTEHELSVGNDHGYVWRYYTYWHLRERDGGVYAQSESIALSRAVPVALTWLINPLVKSVPRGLVCSNLLATRNAIIGAMIASNATHSTPIRNSTSVSAARPASLRSALPR